MTIHSLHPVSEQAESMPEIVRPPLGIPNYEGKQVHSTRIRVTSVAGLECDDKVLKLDAIVNLRVEGRVTGVSHVVNEKTGELMRVHTIKAIDVAFQPWNSGDPSDDGTVQ